MKSRSQFLLRPKALESESLSSWRQRVAWANGYFLFPVPDERTRRADPDVGENEAELRWVSDLHGVGYGTAERMTLRAYVGTVISHLTPRSQPRWWLRARYGVKSLNFGPMFCPSCLGSDSVPYFRFIWRFGFVTMCPLHMVQLHDRCQECGCAPWPSGCGIQSNVHPGFKSLRHCWHCLTDLSAVPQMKLDVRDDIAGWLSQDRLEVGERNVPCIEALGGLRAVCQLFLRNRSRTCIEQSGGEWAQLTRDLSEEAKRTQAVEQLPLQDRIKLVPAGLKIIQGWPDSFLKFASETGISRAHFNGAECLQPSWMTELINSKLAKNNRSVTGDVLKEAVVTLTHELARAPTKTELRKHLAWQGEKGLESIFFKRDQATFSEWRQFLEVIKVTERRLSPNARIQRAFACDVAVLLLCHIDGKQIDSFANVQRQSLASILASRRAGSEQINNAFWQLAVNIEGVLECCALDHDKWGLVSTRQVRERLRQLMVGLPRELVRSVAAFSFSENAEMPIDLGKLCASPPPQLVDR